jgi:dihydrofolate synthase/folylpolyglutamate synthase
MNPTPSERYRQARVWLASRPDFESAPPDRQRATSFPLERPARLLAKLGRPDQRFRIVLIAGTKGKGSTAVLTASILQAHGWRVGLYTQPHLHSFRERLRIDGELIGEAEFADALAALQSAVAAADADQPQLGPLTAYEITTMLTLDWFARRGVDWAVLEVGLGGRLDATNVVTPDLAIITPISYDHTHVLGRTLGAIAAEKAGIIKPGRLVVSAPQRPAAGKVIRRVARQRGAVLVECDGPDPIITPLHLRADTPVVPTSPFFRLRQPRTDHQDLELELYLGGHHQIDNLRTALTGLDQPLLRHGSVVSNSPGRQSRAVIQSPQA